MKVTKFAARNVGTDVQVRVKYLCFGKEGGYIFNLNGDYVRKHGVMQTLKDKISAGMYTGIVLNCAHKTIRFLEERVSK